MRLLVAVVALIAATACRPGHDHAQDQAPDHSHDAAPAATAAHQHPQEPAPAASAPRGPVLDEGRRWKADASTLATVGRMKALVDAPEASADDLPSLRALGKGLRGELDALITGCTMTGAAHEQLHAWLEPVMTGVATLETGDAPQAVAARDALRARVAEFATYFE